MLDPARASFGATWKMQENLPSRSTQDLILRFKCGRVPSIADFYVLVYNDPFHAALHEIWHIVVHSTLR